MIDHTEMLLTVGGVTSTVWRKISTEEVQIVTQQVVTYVDGMGQPVTLPDVYEMDYVRSGQ